MLTVLREELKTKKAKREGILFFLFFLIIFSTIDYLNMSYQEMAIEYGKLLVGTNIVLNIIMSAGTAFMMILSNFMIKMKAIEPKGTKLGIFSIYFAILTYGCTPCVIALLANIGITYSAIVLPFAGLPYKFMTLGLIAIGIAWSLYDINKGACKLKLKKS